MSNSSLHFFAAGKNDSKVVPGYNKKNHAEKPNEERLKHGNIYRVLGCSWMSQSKLIGNWNAEKIGSKCEVDYTNMLHHPTKSKVVYLLDSAMPVRKIYKTREKALTLILTKIRSLLLWMTNENFQFSW